MSEISNNIILVILATSFATYLSRFLGVVSAERIKETSKIFRWFNCLAYSTLAALIARIVIFPLGSLSEIDYLIRLIVVLLSAIKAAISAPGPLVKLSSCTTKALPVFSTDEVIIS